MTSIRGVRIEETFTSSNSIAALTSKCSSCSILPSTRASSTNDNNSASLIVYADSTGINRLTKFCHLFNNQINGFNTNINALNIGCENIATFSGASFANNFGAISPKNNNNKVVTIVAIAPPYVGKIATKNIVATAEPAILTKLFPIKMVDNNDSNCCCNFNVFSARLSPSSLLFFNRTALAEVKAVSLEEKKADKIIQIIKIKIL